ncbi:PQQ-dependent sugar dehydrogenase [Halorussus salilacus]|uniref:PQQ-dependent sugar dehydrogenase n=1 Tax=Halorussus salilacus TaxID=2953750 RepID=UPI00209FDD92|nr:PQQ-dependent sugar dehydrogenase [Halorussus salilacus]USZ69364.1 PQQ-dependent sugar dehydrogenase [Halorussus salilacus]
MDGVPTTSRRHFLAAAGATALAGCGKVEVGEPTPEYDYEVTHDETEWERYDPDWEGPTDPPLPADVEVEVLVENLEIPWDLSFAPTGELFVTERTGRVHEFDGGDLQRIAAPDSVIDAEALSPGPDDEPHWETWFVEGGEGGMLGVAVHPEYPDAPFVYVYFTAETDDGTVNRVVRYDIDADDPADTAEVLVDDIPADTVHNGGRIAFGPANYLWVTVGDAGDPDLAQDPDALPGSVLRLTPDGEPHPDNPDAGDPRVFTYGHRNPQGIAWLPDARPLVTEHGPDGRDEVNLLRAGENYGWPEVRTREEYSEDDAYAHPLVNTAEESWGICGCVFYTGETVPEWTNRLVVGTLIGQHVNVVTLNREGEGPPRDGDAEAYDDSWYDDALAATSHRTFEDVLGRVRHVEQGPDGHLYAITSNRDGRPRGDTFPRERDDVLVRLGPAE